MQFFEEVCVAVYRKIRGRKCFRTITLAQFKELIEGIAEQAADRRLEHFRECFPEPAAFGGYPYPHELFLSHFLEKDTNLLHQSAYWKDIIDRYYRRRISFQAARTFARIFVGTMSTTS